MNTPKLPTALSLTALFLALASTGCAQRAPEGAHTTPSVTTVPNTPPPTPASAHTPAPHAASSAPSAANTTEPTCDGQDYTRAPDASCIYPKRVPWLDALTDPRNVDRSDADDVARAYVQAYQTWDASIDKTSAYAMRRAYIYHTPFTTPISTWPDPDMAKGQGEFLPLVPARAHTTVSIDSVETEGLSPNPLQPDGRWLRVVTYTRTVSGNEAKATQGYAFLTLSKDESGRWQVSDDKWY